MNIVYLLFTWSHHKQCHHGYTGAQRDERKRPRDATGTFLAPSSSHHRPIALLPLLRARRQHHGSSEKLTPDSETASSFELTIPLDVHLPSLVSHEKNIKKSPGRGGCCDLFYFNLYSEIFTELCDLKR